MHAKAAENTIDKSMVWAVSLTGLPSTMPGLGSALGVVLRDLARWPLTLGSIRLLSTKSHVQLVDGRVQRGTVVLSGAGPVG
jgi:hypothetical protein